jgi:hypothetical protein
VPYIIEFAPCPRALGLLWQVPWSIGGNPTEVAITTPTRRPVRAARLQSVAGDTADVPVHEREYPSVDAKQGVTLAPTVRKARASTGPVLFLGTSNQAEGRVCKSEEESRGGHHTLHAPQSSKDVVAASTRVQRSPHRSLAGGLGGEVARAMPPRTRSFARPQPPELRRAVAAPAVNHNPATQRMRRGEGAGRTG